jgi:hypothetical protein
MDLSDFELFIYDTAGDDDEERKALSYFVYSKVTYKVQFGGTAIEKQTV